MLVVDDDPLIRDVLTRFLAKMGCIIEVASDGEAAVEKVRENQFDLVLLDLVLPEMSGQEALESIVGLDPGIPVIIITAYGSTESAVEFLKNGAIDYITKPVHFEEFKFRINRALEEIRLKQHAITDLKTQLFDHYYFEKRLGEELQRAERYGHSISLSSTCCHLLRRSSAASQNRRHISRILIRRAVDRGRSDGFPPLVLRQWPKMPSVRTAGVSVPGIMPNLNPSSAG